MINIYLDSGSWGAKEKAFHFYLQGKALNVFDEYDKEAENNLSKAVCTTHNFFIILI